jgi:hypothetical protein
MDFQTLFAVIIGVIIGYYKFIKKPKSNNKKKTTNAVSNFIPPSQEEIEMELETERTFEKYDLEQVLGGNQMFKNIFGHIDLDLIELMPSRIENYAGGVFGESISKECFKKTANRISSPGFERVVYQLDINDELEFSIFDKISVIFLIVQNVEKDIQFWWPSLSIELETSKITVELREKIRQKIYFFYKTLGNPIDLMENIIDKEKMNSILFDANNEDIWLEWNNLDFELNDSNGEPLVINSKRMQSVLITLAEDKFMITIHL